MFYCEKAIQLRWTSINSNNNNVFVMANSRYLFPINLHEIYTSSLHYTASKLLWRVLCNCKKSWGFTGFTHFLYCSKAWEIKLKEEYTFSTVVSTVSVMPVNASKWVGKTLFVCDSACLYLDKGVVTSVIRKDWACL